jgi:hypothetical protein
VLVLIVWAAAAVLALVILAILGYGLYGQVRRLLRAAEEAGRDVTPKVAALRPAGASGRHRAG